MVVKHRVPVRYAVSSYLPSTWLTLALAVCAVACAEADSADHAQGMIGQSTRALAAVRCSEGPAGVYTSTSPILLGVDYGEAALPSSRLRGVRVIRADVSLSTDPATIADLSCLRRIEGNFDVSRGATDANAAWALQGLEGLREVTGDFSAGGFLGALAGVSGLSGLTKVGGGFGLYAVEARSLDGLESLKSVGGGLGLTVGPAFQSLRALRALESVGGELRIDCAGGGCAGLADLRGLESVRSLSGLSLTYLTGLTKLKGLPPSRRFTGGLTLFGLDSLRSLEGLESLATVDQDVRILGAPALTNVNGLSSLRNVGGNLELDSIPQVVNLDALARLRSVRNLGVQSMDALRSLPRFTDLTSLGGLLLAGLPALPSLRGLERIRTVSDYVWVFAGERTTLDGLEGLVSAGHVQITGNGVASLRPLRNLSTAISLAVAQTQLQSLRGLERLTELGGDLTLQENPNLESLEGLSGLSAISGTFLLGGNPRLASLSGLSNLRQAGSFAFGSLPLLTNFAGLARLTTLTRGMELFDLPALANLQGLESLTSVGGNVQLRELSGLSSLSGLNGLTRVDGVLTLQSLPLLRDLSGPGALSATNGVEIYGNATLASLAGMAALSSVGSGQLVIRNNPQLPGCEAEALANQIGTQCGCPYWTVPNCISPPAQCQPGRPCVPCNSDRYCKCEGTCMCSGNDNAQLCSP
jgi:hypothetical protein